VVHRLARAGLLEVTPEPFGPLDEPVHEPSAAERLAAHEALAEPEPEVEGEGEGEPDVVAFAEPEPEVADEPLEGIRSLDHDPRIGGFDEPLPEVPAGGFGTGGSVPDDEWTSSWGGSNPFVRPLEDPEPDLGVTFGPSLGAAAAGPELAPLDEADMLPRRSSVALDEPNGDLSPGLAGIAGFHDPMADMRREDPVLAQATDEESTLDPNAAWLENLYAQFIDDTTEPTSSKSRKKEALDVAFQSSDQGEGERTGTLRRLVDALRRL
jgi:hypothetical protein